MNPVLLGLYKYVDDMIDAAGRLRDSGYEVSILSPIPLGHELEEALGEPKNHIRYFTFAGAICGFLFGIIFTLGTAAMYVLPRGGRPIFSATPTLLISYETSILIGVFFTLIGFFLMARLPYYKKRVYDPEVNVDSFGLLVDGIREDKYGEVERVLKEHGAKEVKRLEKE